MQKRVREERVHAYSVWCVSVVVGGWEEPPPTHMLISLCGKEYKAVSAGHSPAVLGMCMNAMLRLWPGPGHCRRSKPASTSACGGCPGTQAGVEEPVGRWRREVAAAASSSGKHAPSSPTCDPWPANSLFHSSQTCKTAQRRTYTGFNGLIVCVAPFKQRGTLTSATSSASTMAGTSLRKTTGRRRPMLLPQALATSPTGYYNQALSQGIVHWTARQGRSTCWYSHSRHSTVGPVRITSDGLEHHQLCTCGSQLGVSSGWQSRWVTLAGTRHGRIRRGVLRHRHLHRGRLLIDSSCSLGSLHCCHGQILRGYPFCLLLAHSRPIRGRFRLLHTLLPRWRHRLRWFCICIFQQGTETAGLHVQTPLCCAGRLCRCCCCSSCGDGRKAVSGRQLNQR